MKLFGKPKTKAVTPAAPVAPVINPSTVIFTMPEKFLVPDRPPFWSAGKIWAIVVIVILALVGGVVWVVIALKPAAAPATNTVATVNAPENTAPPIVATDLNAPNTNAVDANAPDLNAPDLNVPDLNAPATNTPSVLTNEPTNAPTDANAPATVPPPSTTPTILPNGKDSDSDGLTDAEEQLLGTDPNNADTDHDGHTDATELMNGYNPKGPGKLSDTNLFSTFTSTKHNYTVLYPSAWAATPAGASEDEVDFTASPDEFIAVTVEANPSAQSILNWYKALPGVQGATAATTETVGSWTGVFSADRRTFYTSTPSRPNDIFVVTYNVGTKTELDYPTMYRFMIVNLATK